MKSLKLLLGILVFVFCGFPLSSPAHAALNDGLVAYYPFNGNAADESGNGYNATEIGVVEYADGVKGKCMLLKQQGFVLTPFIPLLDTNQITITTWIYIASVPSEPIHQIIEALTTAWEVHLETQNYSTDLCWGVNSAQIHSYQIPIQTWVQLAATYDSNGIGIYINGLPVASGGQSGPLNITTGFSIGRDYEQDIQYWDGMIAEVRIYNRVLSDAEIKELYSGLSQPTLTVTPTSPNQIVLSWSDTSDNETGFKIERKAGNCASTNAWGQIATKGANVTTHTNTGLTANKTYAYRVSAYNTAGNSEYSVCKSAKTGLAGTPRSATGLTATSASTGKISLKWTDNSNNETGFKIYRKKDSDPWTLLLTTDMNVKNYEDTSAASNDSTSSYSYYLTACNTAGCSPPTTTAIVPFKPISLKAKPSESEINLKWTDKSGNETGFQLYRKDGSCTSTSSWELISTTAGNIGAYSDTDVTSGTHYSYKVKAFVKSAAPPYATGYSVYTACVSATSP